MNRNGFTLIEIIIYVAILAVMTVFVMGIVMQVGESVVRNRARVDLANEADFVMSKIRWAMSGALAVNEPLGTSTASRLSVQRFNYPLNPLLIELQSGNAVMSKGGGSADILNSENIRVERLDFAHSPASPAASESVAVTMVLYASTSDPKLQSSTTLKSTFYLRK